jgi:hypothetical protein
MPDKKSLLEIVVMPITVSIISIVGGIYLTQQQNSNATVEWQNQLDGARALADAERQLKILEIFAAKITSPNIREQKLALQLLEVMDPDLSKKLANAIAKSEEDHSPIKQLVAEAAVRASARVALSPVYRVDDDPNHPINLRHSIGSRYEIEDTKWAWPWTGSIALDGDSLSGFGSFMKSKATIRVRGKVQPDRRIAVEYVFVTLDGGEDAKGSRTDKHIWGPLQ